MTNQFACPNLEALLEVYEHFKRTKAGLTREYLDVKYKTRQDSIAAMYQNEYFVPFQSTLIPGPKALPLLPDVRQIRKDIRMLSEKIKSTYEYNVLKGDQTRAYSIDGFATTCGMLVDQGRLIYRIGLANTERWYNAQGEQDGGPIIYPIPGIVEWDPLQQLDTKAASSDAERSMCSLVYSALHKALSCRRDRIAKKKEEMANRGLSVSGIEFTDIIKEDMQVLREMAEEATGECKSILLSIDNPDISLPYVQYAVSSIIDEYAWSVQSTFALEAEACRLPPQGNVSTYNDLVVKPLKIVQQDCAAKLSAACLKRRAMMSTDKTETYLDSLGQHVRPVERILRAATQDLQVDQQQALRHCIRSLLFPLTTDVRNALRYINHAPWKPSSVRAMLCEIVRVRIREKRHGALDCLRLMAAAGAGVDPERLLRRLIIEKVLLPGTKLEIPTTKLNSVNQGAIKSIKARVYVQDIDSFRKVQGVTYEAMKHLLTKHGYFDKAEEFIQIAIEKILNEPFHKKDWGGEQNDLYTSNLVIDGRRVPTAFLLKGNGLRKAALQISDCGKNGNQIIRLFESPAELYIIQFVGRISEDVIKDVEQKVHLHITQGKPSCYCIVDGVDTAKLLHAYGIV